MKTTLLFLVVLISCNTTHKKKNGFNSPKTVEYIDFGQHPAMDYFFTRKYRLTKDSLFFFEKDSLQIMDGKNYQLAKSLMDSIPEKALNNEILGHRTVGPEDIPDWTMQIHFIDKDTLFMASGGLPEYMKNYREIVWLVLSDLDSLE